MRDPSFVETCGVCRSLAEPGRRRAPQGTLLGGDQPSPVLFENELWHVRHGDAPHGVAGWTMLIAKRHVAGPAHFDDREAASFGPTLRHLSRTLERVSGALRIYLAAMGESHPHFHAHLVPRYAVMPKDAKAWGVFDLQRAAGAGEITVDPAEVRRVSAALAAALVAAPPPQLNAKRPAAWSRRAFDETQARANGLLGVVCWKYPHDAAIVACDAVPWLDES